MVLENKLYLLTQIPKILNYFLQNFFVGLIMELKYIILVIIIVVVVIVVSSILISNRVGVGGFGLTRSRGFNAHRCLFHI